MLSKLLYFAHIYQEQLKPRNKVGIFCLLTCKVFFSDFNF